MKFKLLFFLGAFGFLQAQVPELLYYNFEGSAANVPNLASNPPAGTNFGTIVGNLTIGANTACLNNGLIGSGSPSTGNYFDTKWNLSLSGSWTIHLKINGYANNNSSLYYLFGDDISGSSFRMFTNGAPGSGNVRLTGNGISTVDITGVFTATPSEVDIIVVYDSAQQTIKAYLNGVLNRTVNQTTAININGTLFRLGGYASNNGLKAGMIMDEFGLYNRAITDAEIANLSSPCTTLSVKDAIKPMVSKDKIYVKDGQLYNYDGEFGEYSIYDMSGKLLLNGNQNTRVISLSMIEKGLYIIRYKGVSQRFVY